MTLQFPNNPNTGQQYTASNNLIYQWDGEKWITRGTAQASGDFVLTSGDNMSGDLTLGIDKITLNAADGSAQFADTEAEITSGGVITGTRFKTTGDARDGAEVGWMAHTGRGVEITRNLLDNDGNTGQALIRGYATGDANPAFELKTDGSASYSGSVSTGTINSASTTTYGSRFTFGGGKTFGKVGCQAIASVTDKGNRNFFEGHVGTSIVYKVNLNGDAEFAGSVTTGGISRTYRKTSASSAQLAVFKSDVGGVDEQKITLFASGNAVFVGTVNAANVTFNLEADDDTKYTATTDADGEQTLVYSGAVLDVKDRLQKTDAALAALKSAAAAASDFAALKSAIATALADI